MNGLPIASVIRFLVRLAIHIHRLINISNHRPTIPNYLSTQIR